MGKFLVFQLNQVGNATNGDGWSHDGANSDNEKRSEIIPSFVPASGIAARQISCTHTTISTRQKPRIRPHFHHENAVKIVDRQIICERRSASSD
jgi:hypothetical protein